MVPDDATAYLYYRQLIEELVGLGNDLTVFSAPGPYVQKLVDAGATHIPVPYERFIAPLADVRLYRALVGEFRRSRFDVIQNFTVKANLYGALAARRARVPVIINTVEGAGILWSPKPRLSVRLMREAVERVLRSLKPHVFMYWFVNTHDLNLFLERGLCDRDRSVVAISTGVDCELFDPYSFSAAQRSGIKRDLAIPDGMPVITMVAGRLLKSKGVEAFIELARELRRRNIQFHALLAGPKELDHPDALDHSVVDKAEAEGVVKWIGFRSDVPEIYAISDIAVVPTAYPEGIAKSVAEPMAMGLPVVCSHTPAIEEMVQPDIDAIVVPAGDSAALADAVADLLANTERRALIGAKARLSIMRRFEAKREASQAVHQVYGRIKGWRSSQPKSA